METTRQNGEGARAELGLWDATSIIVGIMIGVGIFEMPQIVFKQAPGPWEAMLTWVVGGILALVGALCFAELAGAYPHSGGEYVYLTRAYGPLSGFLFGWAQLAVIRPASIGALAYIFAERAETLLPADLIAGSLIESKLLLALIAVAVLTVINVLGATLGATTQNLLTAAKVLGLGGMIVWLLRAPLHFPAVESVAAKPGWFASSMVVVLWTYAGWNEAAYIAAEVKNSRKNLPLALILGTLGVTLIYLLVNGAMLLALGFDGARSQKPAMIIQGDVGRVVNIMIMISALGAINGMIFTTARISSAFGQDHRLFRSLGHWSRWGAPVRALAICGFLNLSYLAGAALIGTGQNSLEFWIDLTAAVFWFFFLLTGLALLVLRVKEPLAARPFRVPWYPFLPLVFSGWCAYMVVASISKFPMESFFGFLVLLAGLPFYYLPQKKKKPRMSEVEPPLVEV